MRKKKSSPKPGRPRAHPARRPAKSAAHRGKAPERAAPRPRAKKHPPHAKHHRCDFCGHTAPHANKVGCTHFEGSRFCSCKHRG
jgi:hypothetical protein